MVKSDKKLILLTATIIILITILLVGYDLDQKSQLQVKQLYKSTSFQNNNNSIQYHIDSIDIAGNTGKIHGWAFIKGTNSFNIIPTIILKSEDGNLYKLTTRITQRGDITDLFNGIPNNDGVISDSSHLTCENKYKIGEPHRLVYDNCGIISNFKIDNLKKNKLYKIGIELSKGNNKYFIWTNRTLKL